MSGTFASFNTALSGLRYQQLALDIASTNVTNATTDGYVRRRVVGETVGAPTVPGLWSRSTPEGSGVRATGIDRMTDALLDSRVRAEHGKQSYLDLRSEVMSRVETGFAEPGDSGVSGALADFKATLHDLANAPGSEAARGQVLASATTLADAINLQAGQLEAEAADQRSGLVSSVAEANQIASDLAATNHSIVVARNNQADASTLLDTRDRLALRLSELTGAVGTVREDGGIDMTVSGVALVTGGDAGELRLTGGVTPEGEADDPPVALAVTFDDGATLNAVPDPVGGRVGAVVDLLDRTIPAYAAGLDEVARGLAEAVNAAQAAGFDQTGAVGGPLFAYDADHPAASLSLAVPADATERVAASAVAGTLDGSNALDLAAAVGTVEDPYSRLVSGFGTQVASAERMAANQQALTTQVDTSREQLAGVSLDEETVNMVTAQRAYEAAARVMTVLDSVLDTLVNRTGLVR